MASSSSSTSFLLLLALLLVRCRWGLGLEKVRASTATETATATGSELWCVAKNNAEDAALQPALDWACGPGGADCSPIQQGGACSDPPDIQSYASYAFNDYFHRNGLSDSACDFSGTAALTILNPSHGNCVFPSSTSSKIGNFSGSAAPDMGQAAADTSGVPPITLPTWGFLSTVVFAMML